MGSLLYPFLNLMHNENERFYNEVNAWLFDKDRVSKFSSNVIHGIRATSEICNMHEICFEL